MNNSNVNAFFELVRAGIWGKECRLSQYQDIDFAEIYRITEEQSVTGLVTAGLERARDVKIPQEWTLQFVGATLQLEQRNKDMNGFLVKLFTILSNTSLVAVIASWAKALPTLSYCLLTMAALMVVVRFVMLMLRKTAEFVCFTRRMAA